MFAKNCDASKSSSSPPDKQRRREKESCEIFKYENSKKINEVSGFSYQLLGTYRSPPSPMFEEQQIPRCRTTLPNGSMRHTQYDNRISRYQVMMRKRRETLEARKLLRLGAPSEVEWQIGKKYLPTYLPYLTYLPTFAGSTLVPTCTSAL